MFRARHSFGGLEIDVEIAALICDDSRMSASTERIRVKEIYKKIL